MEKLTLESLSEWLNNLKCIPKRRERKETLLDIAGIDHLETHWSYIYMYFFNPDASHGMSRLFIDTFLDIISKKSGKDRLLMDSFSVSREVVVSDEKDNLKRIDLLIQNDEEAIIIENKVFAPLNNRLDLYWSKPNVVEENKRGVVLSLKHICPTHHGFINITHEEYAMAIEKALPVFINDVQPKALILLQDFIQNIYNVTHLMNEEEFKFYFTEGNREKINRLAEIKKNVIEHIWKPIEDEELLKQLFKDEKWELSVRTKNRDNYVYYTFDSMPDKVMLTLVYDSLWTFNPKCCIRMFLEIGTKEMISKVEQHLTELKEMGIEPNGHKDRTWWHFKGYEIPFTVDELSDKSVIVEKIIKSIRESGFYDDGLKIINLLKKENQVTAF